MKKLLALLIIATIIFSLVSCGSNDPEWKKFLKEYEEWIDNYIEMVDKYKSNPTDMAIWEDYSEMLSELSDWSARSDEIQAELEDTDEALEYAAEVLRIVGKMSKVGY